MSVTDADGKIIRAKAPAIIHGDRDLEKLLRTLIAARDLRMFNRAQFFEPYPKQCDFFDNGATHDERLFMAGNQLGKTEAGAYETMVHMSGKYPDWWMGHTWKRQTKGWICGETANMVRGGPQKKLCGEPGVDEAFGTGYIPRDLFVGKPSLARGVTDAFDTIQVRHISKGVSVAGFKSYEQGRTKFQTESLDWIWFDEEPEADIYSEGITRLTATKGIAYMTFTPLKGMSEVVMRFLNEKSPDRAVTTMTIDEALHIPEEERKKIIARYRPHERDARSKGIPMFGEGRIFDTLEENITEPRIDQVPPEWAKLWGIDFGISHPFAAVLIAWDRDADVVHILHTIRVKDQMAMQHAKAMKAVGSAVPVAWPQDGTAREHGTGENLASVYRNEGLRMRPEHASWKEGGVSTEKGIIEMHDRMESGRLKVAAHLGDWFEEYRMYHREKGQIVKIHDDLMSATRIAIMDLRHAKPVGLGGGFMKSKRRNNVAQGIDFDVFG